MELSGTFSQLGGTELVTFVKIGTCNGTSYNFVPLERNLTSYIWNGTFDTTAGGCLEQGAEVHCHCQERKLYIVC